MNKNCYRIIFSQARGIFIAVAEIAKSRSKTAGQSHAIGGVEIENTSATSSITYKKLNPINFAVLSLLGAAIYTVPMAAIADSQIIADRSAPKTQQATILNSSNGLAQVNIQTPSAGGVSRNTYTQFDVGQEGAILNNSRNNTQTQIGGWVQGNPWLAKGEAKVILNEVNSSNPSQLKGYLEVAGKQAQVVIANPSGIVCDGCGVINADRFTLTTGQVVTNQGYLESFRVREGQVTIGGKGLNGSLTPYTDVYARALKVNAGLYANELNTVLGQNGIQVKDQVKPQVTAVSASNSNTNNNPVQDFALDIGQLGGMYAGKIYLVGTEQGLGVRNAGSINTTTGQLNLNANGDLTNTGNMIANKDQVLVQAKNIKNSGNISSTQQQIQIIADNLQNTGLIATDDEIKLNVQDKIDNNDGVINAGRIDFNAQSLSNDQGKIEQTGQQQLNISAKTLDNTQGLIGQTTKDNIGKDQSSGGTISTTITDPKEQSSAKDSSTVDVVTPLDLTPKNFAAGNIQIAQDISNISGRMINNADITLKIQDSIKNNGGEIQLPELQFNGDNFENQQGKIYTQVANITAQNLDNAKGLMLASESFDLNTQQLNNNQGRLQSSKAFALNSKQIDNTQGQILASELLTLQSDNTNNTDGVIASVKGDALLNITILDNKSGEISAQNLELNGQSLKNHQGSIQSKTGLLSLKVDQIDNGTTQDTAGSLIAAQNLKLDAQQLTTTGQIYAADTADLTVSQLKQHGQLAAQQKINVQSDSVESNQNAVWAAGLDKDGKLSNTTAQLNIEAQNVQLAAKVLSGATLQIKAAQTADLSLSEQQASNIKIETKQLKTDNAKIIADQQLDITATESIANQKGQYSAAQVNVNTLQLNNDQGLIQHTGLNDFSLNIADRIDNNAGQIISNAARTEIQTKTLNSVAGAILHAGDQQLKITAQNVQGQQGKIQSNSSLLMDVGVADLNQAITSAQNIDLNATELSHQQGQLIQSDAAGELKVNVAQTFNNTSGVISAAGNAQLNTTQLNNQQGVIQTLANKDLSIVSQQLDNQSGKIITGRNADLKLGHLNNDDGTVYAADQLKINADQFVSNQNGLIASQQTLSITGQNLNNQAGKIQSEEGDVNLNLSEKINNNAGHIQSAQALTINSPNLENQAGQLISGSNLKLDVAELNNNLGTIYSKKQLDVNALGTANNDSGVLAAEQTLNLTAGQLFNNAGQIRSEKADVNLLVKQDVENNKGLISSAKNLSFNARDVQSQQGKIQSAESANIQLNNLDSTEGLVYAAGQLKLSATGELNNTQGVIASEQLADIQAGSVSNDAGQIRSQQDQLKLNVQQDVSNVSGEISAAKGVEFTAKKITNQQGKVIAGGALTVNAQQIENAKGTFYTKDQLNMNVADQINNQSGIIAAEQQLQVQANDLNNQAGKIRSEQNQLNINVQQLDNQTGEIFSGKNAAIRTTINNNQLGTIYSKNQLDLNATQLNNQQGQIYSQGQAQIKVQGEIQNQTGVLGAAQNLNIQSAGLNNTSGIIRSENADITLNAQGQLINQKGDIYAGQNASLNSVGLDNTAGQIAAQNQLSIDTQKQQLSNQNGKIIGTTVDLKTGKLDNQTGLIQAEQSVKVDTQNQVLLNNNSGSNAGILSQGSLDIANVSQLENSSGYIAAIGLANITAQNINNNSGQINSQADLTLQQQTAGGGIDNNAGQIQAQQNVSLNSDTINNSGVGSHIVAGEKLNATAKQFINTQTKDTTTLGGIDAKNIEINAQELDNQSGVIRASENATLNVNNQLSNQLGSISSLDTLSIGTADKSLNINNTAGELLANKQLNIKANGLTNKGKVISLGDVDIDLKQSYTHTKDDQISANGTLKLHTENDLINQSEFTAGQKIALSAQNIKNETGATIASNETHLIAQDTVHNQGLINGELTHIQANHVWNDGARIYGTHVAIQANTLDNKSNSAGIGAVIASRGDMDLGVGTLNNQAGQAVAVKENARDNAWIFSAGDLSVGGRLDENLKAQGKGDTINNLSARIESLGDMTLNAKNINNINQNFETEIVQIGGPTQKLYIQPKDKLTKIPVENLVRRNWSRTYLYRYNTAPNVLPENIIFGETPIPNVESINCVGTGDDQRCNVNYKNEDPVWAYFKITPPAKNAPEAPTLVQPEAPVGQISCESGTGYDADACSAYNTAYTKYEEDKLTYDQALQEYKAKLEAWEGNDEERYQQLDDAIQNYNSQFANSEFKKWTQYDVQETEFESQVKTSAPAEIIAGGDLKIDADAFKNDKSHVLAGGVLDAKLTKPLVNLDGEGVTILKQTGTSQYTQERWRGGFKRYYQRSWGDLIYGYNAEEVESKVLPVQKWLGDVKNHTSNQNISKLMTGTVETSLSLVDVPTEQKDRQQQGMQTQFNIDAGQTISANGENIKGPNTLAELDINNQNKQNLDAEQQQVKALDAAQNLQAGDANASKATAQKDIEIRTVSMDFMNLPSNALFSTLADSQAKYLVETDPAYANYKNWLSSDYMLDALELDPALKQKRLGDGYYEQRLVQDQIAQLTGYRFLQGYGSDEAQYKALMNNGLTFAKAYNLRPGIALTAAQIAQLTSDIVWMEEKTINMADGTTTKALVPQVYVKLRQGDLKGDGTLLSAEQVKFDVKGDVLNSATIAGREAVKISAENINQLGGRIETNRLNLKTTQDLNNNGGIIVARETANLDIGGDFNHTSTTNYTENKVGEGYFTREGLDRKAGLYVGNSSQAVNPQDKTLNIRVGGDTNLKGAEIINYNGSSVIQTLGDLNIEGVNTSVNNRGYANQDSFNYEKRQEDIGSVIQSKGDTRLQAENITVKGSTISSGEGSTILSAQQKIEISEGRKLFDAEQAYKIQEKGTLSKTERKGHVRNMSDEAIASNIEGKKVILDANNIDIRGSNIVSDELTQLQAKENVTIQGAENQYLNYSESSVKKSGLMSSGGIGFSLGQKKELTEQENTQKTNTRSMVGSLEGNTNIIAGKTYQQTGSTVSSQEGDVNILAEQVKIEAAKEQSTNDYKYQMEQKGLTLAVNVPIVAAVQSALDSTKQVGQSKNDRVNAMAAANAGFDTYKAGQSLGQLKDLMNGTDALNKSVEVGVSLTYGEQKTTNTSHSERDQASQSQVYAGGTTNIVATGAGKDSNINIIGSDVMGMKGTNLAAENDVNIKAAEQNGLEQSNNKSSGWNAGVTISNQTGLGVTAGGNLGKGRGDGTDTSYVNSHVGSKESGTSISSGNATNIIGGQVQGKGVQVDAQELNIESLQDTATYQSKQQNISGQVSVGTNGGNVSGSYGKSNIDANYRSVNEQSGIYAGDDGYQINVKNNTDLKGAIITSTQKAEDLKKNSINTGTLSHSDLQNVSEYDAKGIGISAGFNAGKAGDKTTDTAGEKQPNTVLSAPNKIDQPASRQIGVTKSIGFGLDSDKDSSVTQSGINTSNITIRETVRQEELTGKSVEQIKSEILTNVTTDTARENSGALKNNFDKDQVQSEINLQVDVTKKFDETRQGVKQEIYNKVDKMRAEAEAIRSKNFIDGKNGYNTSESLKLEAEANKLEKYAFYADGASGALYGLGNTEAFTYVGSAVVADPVKRAATAPTQVWQVKCDGDSLYCADSNLDKSKRPLENDKAQIGDKRQIFDISEIKQSESTGVITVSNNGIMNP